MKLISLQLTLSIFTLAMLQTAISQNITYPVVDTRTHDYYSNSALISAPAVGAAFYGQDASYQGNEPSYTNNGNGTITDNVTGLVWQQDMGSKITYADAFKKADTMTLGGFTDWRVPTIKELYSLIEFSGRVNGMTPIRRFIDSVYFNQPLGDTSIDERFIDAQTWSSTQYVGLTMGSDTTVFGVNFIDGRIKGYPKYKPGSGGKSPNSMFFRMVRGNTNYGINHFVDNGDGTITDNATGLMWQQADDGVARDWGSSLSYAENLNYAGYTDWRLPNAKELHSIVDYTRCPDITNSPAIDPLFSTTMINDPNGNSNQYPYFWTSTSHLESTSPYTQGVYIAFGEAQGKMNNVLKDVHGAGAQRSDPKTGSAADYPQYSGPQGDVRYVFNYVRCVRNASASTGIDDAQGYVINIYPNPISENATVEIRVPGSARMSVSIIDIMGQELQSAASEMVISGYFKMELPIGNLKKGTYLLKVSIDGKTLYKKMMVQ